MSTRTRTRRGRGRGRGRRIRGVLVRADTLPVRVRRKVRGGKFKPSTGFSAAGAAGLIGSAVQPELAPVLLPFAGISTGIGRILGAFGAGIKKKPKKRARKRRGRGRGRRRR